MYDLINDGQCEVANSLQSVDLLCNMPDWKSPLATTYFRSAATQKRKTCCLQRIGEGWNYLFTVAYAHGHHYGFMIMKLITVIQVLTATVCDIKVSHIALVFIKSASVSKRRMDKRCQTPHMQSVARNVTFSNLLRDHGCVCVCACVCLFIPTHTDWQCERTVSETVIRTVGRSSRYR